MTDPEDVAIHCGSCGQEHETVKDVQNCECEELEPEHAMGNKCPSCGAIGGHTRTTFGPANDGRNLERYCRSCNRKFLTTDADFIDQRNTQIDTDLSIEPAAIMRHDGRIITEDSGIYWQNPFDYYWSKPQVAGVESLVSHWNEKVEDHKVESLETLFAGSDIADKLEDLTTAHGHVIKDEEALKTLIRDLRSKNEV